MADPIQPTPPAEGEVAAITRLIPLVIDRAAELLQQQEAEIKRLRAQQTPVPVSEGLPGDQLCWWYEPDEEDGYGGSWTLLRIRGGTSAYTHWLPAHALPLPQGEVE